MLGIVGVGARDLAQIQDAAGGCPVQGAQETDRAVNGQNDTEG